DPQRDDLAAVDPGVASRQPFAARGQGRRDGMAERNGERHLELAARPQCVALLDRASRARTAFGTVETQSERAQLDEAGAAPAASLDHGLPDGRPQSRAEDPALVAFTRP